MVVEWSTFVHQPTPVQAFQWDGSCIPPDAFSPEDRARFGLKVVGHKLSIMTRRGLAYADAGDWIVFDTSRGEVWPIKPDTFGKVYTCTQQAIR